MVFFFAFATGLVVSLLFVPVVRKIALKYDVLDVPDERKIHTRLIPRMGGVAIWIGFGVATLFFFDGGERFFGIFLGLAVMGALGLADDVRGLDARIKLPIQFLAAWLAIEFSQLDITFLGGVFGSSFDLGPFSTPLTLFWIVGITNAINLSDGLDGLAGGICAIALTSFGWLAFQRGDMELVMLCSCLLGSTLGFLRYNTHPADIFMGDSGSLFLGFSLATLSLVGNFKSLTAVTLLSPILVLFVPIVDTLWAVVRRLLERRSPFSPDKKHLHHRLLARGMDQNQSVSLIYAFSAGLSAIGVALADSTQFKYVLVPLILLFLLLVLSQVFGWINLEKQSLFWSRKLDRWVASHLHPNFAQSFLYLSYFPLVFYFLMFILGFQTVSLNLMVVAGFLVLLVASLVLSKRPNAHSFLIFSSYFLSVIILFLGREALVSRPWVGQLEPFVFGFLAFCVLGHFLFKKRLDLILTTPLELLILLLLVSITIVPAEWQERAHLPFLVSRSVVVFLLFKSIIFASGRARARIQMAASSLISLGSGFFR